MTSSGEVLSRLPTRIAEPIPDRLLDDHHPESVAVPRPAATVVLLRDHHDTLQTYALHRHSRMPFAPGVVVFPGGRLDPVDGVRDPDHGLEDPAMLACAVRETAEETGVRLPPSQLHPWAHWITPEAEPRRYDTGFYLAAMPPDQTAADISGETSGAEWRAVTDLLRAADDGELRLMPPTRAALIELSDHACVRTALEAAAERMIETVMPHPVRRPEGWFWSWRR